ncbi:hypothetical protein G9F73_016470 [Clostridium estertheticum]|uniref:hypothetical protein n=1 Tax=Clostridium estertheticum TaxID=238834 RepID=UPI0013EED42F|nr:hypothetical protein [Clostridium estertheticum]MBZ9609385.1 hypothetical protein [Clostridium estertheticum]
MNGSIIVNHDKFKMLEKSEQCITINNQSAQQANSNNIAQFSKARNTINALKKSNSIYKEKEKKLKAIEDGKVVDEIKVMADAIAEIAMNWYKSLRFKGNISDKTMHSKIR